MEAIKNNNIKNLKKNSNIIKITSFYKREGKTVKELLKDMLIMTKRDGKD